MFLTLTMKEGGTVGFGGNQTSKIIGTGTIGNSSISINNVWLVDGLRHNLLSISQFCDNGYDVLFVKNNCTVINKDDQSIAFKGKRRNNVYKINFLELADQKVLCLLLMSDKKWLWHRRLGHANWRLINKLSKLQLVKGLLDTDYRGGEVENEPFEIFCEKHGIIHEFSSPRTPQQNGVVERKNRSLQEMARTMIHENNLAKHFWAEAVNTACYVQNRIYIRPLLNKTTYELFKGRKPNISYFHQFGCKCYILNNKVYLKKFDAKTQNGIFLGYSERSKAYRLYNSETHCVEESMHVKFDDKEPGSKTPEQDESIAGSEESDNYSEPDQTPESDDTSEAVTAPDVLVVEASEEDHIDSQQVIQSRNSFKYKSSHPED